MDQIITILVADDDPIVRKCVRHAVDAVPNFAVQWEAENGLQALILAKQHNPHLILMDAQMPRMDGIEATRCLRQCGIKARVVIVSVFERFRSEALEAGADAFVIKDCGCKQLRSVLSSVLNIDRNFEDISYHACSGDNKKTILD